MSENEVEPGEGAIKNYPLKVVADWPTYLTGEINTMNSYLFTSYIIF